MNLESIKAVQQLLSQPQKIVIVPHKNPDGDAIGSTLALCHYLVNRGQEAVVVAPNDYPKFLKWMPGNENILNFEKQNSQAKEKIAEATVIFTLDFNHLGRIGQMQSVLESLTVPFVMIDHHQAPSDYAQIMYSDVTMTSTCEMVYNFIEFLGDVDKITSEMADCLYTGIMTDTGSFKFRSTTGRTHRVVADLIDKGAENTEIHHRVFDTNTPGRLHLLGCALKNMVILDKYRTAYITLSQEELDAHEYQKGDTEGFVNYGLTLEGIIFAVIFIENKDEGIIKISFRSIGEFSVNEFARAHFEGGGHDNAAGGKSDRSLKETTLYFESLLENYQEQLQA
ncbi:bifunctional oligoribonuclease/PAP phosphatase NrnA [Zobellia russellii]|uniref:DHH family phosphoesterase n=1 Tax=Zobellia russellii TaxID=248907 RepID=UPI001BFEF3B9|nr:bifunctional oligoribonuclease/PAP phosphatase NrnA [Zobellia russellii]MBT9188959.1 bifunctional oligoribonuclease/PAP phosphatase NrnA [Zobellia russellii]